MKIKIGLPKGRLLKDSVYTFKKIGLDFSPALDESRNLMFTTADGTTEAIVIRAADMLTYVEYGAVDMGIVGYDLIKEQRHDVITAFAFNFGKCRLSVAEPENNKVMERTDLSGIRVATRYSYLASQYFKQKGFQVDIIKLSGAVELAPLFGISDVIVDLVSTGKTLNVNGLAEREVIMQSSARFVLNKASMRIKQRDIDNIIVRLKKIK